MQRAAQILVRCNAQERFLRSETWKRQERRKKKEGEIRDCVMRRGGGGPSHPSRNERLHKVSQGVNELEE